MLTEMRRLGSRPMVAPIRLVAPSMTLGPGLLRSRCVRAVATTSSGCASWPSLRARLLEKRLRWQEMLVPLIAARVTGRPGAAHLHATAILASALACLDAASGAWVASDGKEDLAALYDEAVAAVRS